MLENLDGFTRLVESPPFLKVVDIVAKLLLSEILQGS
jgi:hypothetical protein